VGALALLALAGALVLTAQASGSMDSGAPGAGDGFGSERRG